MLDVQNLLLLSRSYYFFLQLNISICAKSNFRIQSWFQQFLLHQKYWIIFQYWSTYLFQLENLITTYFVIIINLFFNYLLLIIFLLLLFFNSITFYLITLFISIIIVIYNINFCSLISYNFKIDKHWLQKICISFSCSFRLYLICQVTNYFISVLEILQ